MAHHPASRGPGERLARGWFVATLAGGVVEAALGGWTTGLAVLALSGVAWLATGRRVRAELDAHERLAAAVDALVAGAPVDLPAVGGDAARTAQGIAALLARAREQEAAGREAIDRTAAMLDAAPSGIALVGTDGRVEHVNTSLGRVLRLQKDPVGHTPLEALLALEVVEAIEEASQGRASAPRDFVLGDRDLSVTANPMRDGVLTVVRDVTHERAVERSRTDFVANVSHELRTPVAAILGFAETLAETPGGLPKEVAPMVRAIHRNAVRLRQLFEDLLTLHRIEVRRHELPRDDVALGPLLAEAVVPSADVAAGKGIGFELDVPPTLRAWVNPAALSAIVGNLVGNACKYTPAGGTVRVAATAVGDQVRIDVQDTGIGISRPHQERVFERFYRVDEGRAREVGGAGLGLAIVKHLAEATGCRITLQSEEGRGSTFSVHVPRTAPPRAARVWDATLPAAGDRGAER